MTTELSTQQAIEFTSPEQQESSSSLRYAWRRKWIVLLLVVIAMGLGFLYFLNETPIYESTAQILIIQHQAMQGIQGLDLTEYDNTHEILIRSPTVANIALEKYDIKSQPTIHKSPNQIATIISGLKVTRESRDRTTGDVYKMSYRSESDADCMIVLRALVKAYELFLSETYKGENNDAAKLIGQARGDLERQIIEAETDYGNFRLKHPELYVGQATMNVPEQRLPVFEAERKTALVDNQKIQAQIALLDDAIKRNTSKDTLNLMAAQFSRDNTSSDRAPIADATDKALSGMLIQLQIEEMNLLAKYGKEHPNVSNIRKTIEFLKQHEEENKLAEATRSEGPKREYYEVYFEALKERMKANDLIIANMTRLFDDQNKAANALAATQRDDETYRATIARQKKLYDTVVNRLDDISIVKDTGTVQVELIHPPYNGIQVKPDLAIVLGVSAVAGLLAGLGLAYVVDRADRRFRSPDEVRNDLGLPVVGHIPVIPSEGKESEMEVSEDGQPALSPVLRTFHHPRGRIAEAYRAVRTALYFSTRGSGHQVIQITSPSPGDGKTTLACNLAVSIAQSGKRVLLVDADFRRPRCHRVFGADNSTGVTSVLDGSAELSDVLLDTGVANLSLLPCGIRPANPSELLTSRRFEELLAMLREKFDFVIVDTPPVLAVTDPLNVVTRVDGVVLVMRLSKSARAASRRAMEALDELGANMLGVVVNGVGGGRGYGEYGKYGYGYSGYGYGYGGYGYGYGYGYGGNGYGGYDYRYGYADSDKSYYEEGDENGNGKTRPRIAHGKNGKS